VSVIALIQRLVRSPASAENARRGFVVYERLDAGCQLENVAGTEY
jgi:hypothetical protein